LSQPRTIFDSISEKIVMYDFNIGQEPDGSFRFERDGIHLLVDAFYEQEGKHYIQNPDKAIAYFKTGGNLYGISNNIITYSTVEDFFESMAEQYHIFAGQKSA
jgi:hypothetical protein